MDALNLNGLQNSEMNMVFKYIIFYYCLSRAQLTLDCEEVVKGSGFLDLLMRNLIRISLPDNYVW